MRLVGHVDPVVLERGLIQRIARAHDGAAAARTTILVPTQRLRDYVLGRLAEHRAAWLGVEVLTVRAFAASAAERAGLGLRVLDPRVAEALAARLLRDSSGTWSELAGRRPGVIGRVAGALTDLREAGVAPATLDRAAEGSARFEELARLYRSWVDALAGLAESGLVDEAGLVARVLRQAGALATEGSEVLVHGAYEWTGHFLDLLRALDREREITVFAPVLPGSIVTAFAERFARQFLIPADFEAKIEILDDGDAATLGARLAGLYRDADDHEPLSTGRVRFRHVQGAGSAARCAVREALAAIAAGCPPDEIVIAARGFAPWSAALEQALAQAGVPWSGSLAAPLRRDPTVRALCVALEVVERGYPRRLTVELLGSTAVDWSRVTRERRAPDGDLADRLSRGAGIVGGLDEWRERLPATAGGPTPEIDRILDILSALDLGLAPDRERTWSEHGASVERWLRELVPAEVESAGLAQFRRLLSTLADLDALPGARPVTLAAFRAWLDRAVDVTEMPLERGDGAGIRVLDAMQLRGMTFRRAILLGFNAREIPRVIREDPVLPDALRRKLREEHACPIPIKEDAAQEERLLLALLLGAARDRLDLSWQRADDRGRGVAPSLALREVARLLHGEPDPARVIAGATHIPSHPARWIEHVLDDAGLLAPDEERLLAVLRSSAPSPALADAFPELAPSFAMLRATDSFRGLPTRWDGRIEGGLDPARILGATAVATLATCPLQFLFKHLLRVAELPEEPDPLRIESAQLGIRVHEILAEIFARLEARGHVEAELPGWIAESWNRHFRQPTAHLARRAPAFWAHFARRWQEALLAFLREDLARLAARAKHSMRLEEEVRGTIDLGAAPPLLLRARFDRRVETPGGSIISDFKTGSLRQPSPLEYLRGEALQAPLYWLVAGDSAEVELLGVRPRTDDEADPPIVGFAGFADPQLKAGLLDTIRVVLDQARRGAYALREGRHCGYCEFKTACRHDHPPTLARESAAEDARALRLIASKTTKLPLVSDHAARAGEHDDAEETS